MPEVPPPVPTGEELLRMYRFMKLHREIEMRVIALYRLGKIVGGVYTGTGNEATAVGAASALSLGDILLPMHRDMGAHLVFGQTPRNLLAQYLNRADSPTHGRDGNMHQGDLSRNIIAMVSHLGVGIPVAAGVAMQSKLRKAGQVVLTFIGDGGSNIGDFHEGLNFAAVMDLPMILVIENNQFAYSTPVAKQYRCADLADRAKAYGIPGVIVDGNDVVAVWSAVRVAVDRARSGGGPTLIESKTMRMRGHSEHDDAFYVPRELLSQWAKHDPMTLAEERLTGMDLLTHDSKAALELEIRNEVLAAADDALAGEYPPGEQVLEGVYA